MAGAQSGMVLIYSTAPDVAVANALARSVVAAKYAACVNVLPGMMSTYQWQGDIQCDEEAVMLIKTTADLQHKCMAFIAEQHPYDEPCAFVLPVSQGLPGFLAWIQAETRDPAN